MEEAVGLIKDGDSLMIGGFAAVGTPQRVVDAVLAAGKKDLTVITNDTGFEDRGLGVLITAGRVKKVVTSHIGLNRRTGAQLNAGKIEVELVPQGTLAERIRAAAYGLGGALTPTGIGTDVEAGKRKLEIDGKEYLLETPLRADAALLYADIADESGNLAYRGAAGNFNNVMAGAARVTIAEAGRVVPPGGLAPNAVHTPGVFVDYVVKG